MVKHSLILYFVIVAACVVITSPSLCGQGGTPVFLYRGVPEVSATPVRNLPPSERVPRGVIIGAAVAAVFVGALLVFAAHRAWRSASVFERKYYFPASEKSAALRFGGNRSGGLMATIGPEKKKKP